MRIEQPGGGEIKQTIELIWRRKWIILVPFLIVFISVSLFGLYLPNKYRSSTLILIEPQEVPRDYVRTTVTADFTEERMRTLTNQLKSRTILEKVIDTVNLYPEASENLVPMESLVELMSSNLAIEIPRGRNPNYFRIHFIHEDPVKAKDAVSKLSTFFIEESLQVREQQATGTTKFIEDELENLKKTLEKSEAAIRSYKQRFMGELPQQLDANLRVLDNLHLQLADNLETQREIENRIILLEQDITRLETQYQLSTSIAEGSDVVDTSLAQLLVQRDTLVQEIDHLDATYTDQHPDLISAKIELKKIDVKVRSIRENLAARASDEAPPPTSAEDHTEYTRELANAKRQLNESDSHLLLLEEEEGTLREKIALYQNRVEVVPRREQQLLALTRDYENTKISYEDLLQKKLEAQLSENLEKRQKGEKFRVLDPANHPQRPYMPNRPRIIFMGFMGGMGVGVGLAFLLEMLIPAFFNLRQVNEVVELPIIMGIPEIVSARDKRRIWLYRILGTLVCLSILVTLLFAFHKYIIDLNVFADRILTNVRSLSL